MQVLKIGIVGAILIAVLLLIYYRQVFLPQEREKLIQQRQIENAIKRY